MAFTHTNERGTLYHLNCKDVTFKIMGLSLATINTIMSLILSAITIKLFLNYEKN